MVDPESIKAIASVAIEPYRDLAQPAAREVGAVAGRGVRALLAPVRALIWTLERVEEYVERKVTARLDGVSEEKRLPPPPEIAAPVFMAISIAGEESLRTMYAELLAASMDADRARIAHPGFVEVIRQLSPDEARILNFIRDRGGELPFVDVRAVELTRGYTTRAPCIVQFPSDVSRQSDLNVVFLKNLERLGLIGLIDGSYSDDAMYAGLIESPEVKEAIEEIEFHEKDIGGTAVAEIVRSGYELTAWGDQFIEACMPDW